ncbi:MAG TPA: cytidylate kinase-like family protein [Sporichthyaceae bacterium]|jgi:cytidylate kinase|nr:cytidylate kinase-like family protein [Sporichthyaceae bacterium]
MAFRVVCISAVDGSGGEQVGPLVAEQLGYRLVNEEIVALAARQAELAPAQIADVERRKSLINRVLDRLGPTAVATSTMGAYVSPMVDDTPDEAALRDLIRAAIGQVAELGGVVIMAHAGSYALRARRDTLRVFLTASPEARADRLSQDAKQLAKLDANRADYLKRFYDIGAEQPHHYDVVLNTDHLEPSAAAGIIAGLTTA